MHSQERKECLWGFLIGICRQPIVWGNIFLTRILHLMHLFCKKPRKIRKFLFGNLTQNIQIIWQTRYCSATISPNLWIEESLLKINFSQCLLLFSDFSLTMLFHYFLLFCFSLEVFFFYSNVCRDTNEEVIWPMLWPTKTILMKNFLFLRKIKIGEITFFLKRQISKRGEKEFMCGSPQATFNGFK
jgi:hypothetical protein